MSRPENSALIALRELQTLETARARDEEERRRADAEQLAAQREEARRLAVAQEEQRAVAEAKRNADAERQRAWEAAEARRRIESAEAAARVEHNARLLELQRELETELDRRERRRSGRLVAVGVGAAMVAAAAAVAAWVWVPSDPVDAPKVAETSKVDVDALAEELDQLRRDNASIRDNIRDAEARSDALAAATAEAAAAPAPETRSQTKGPKRPRPKRPDAKPTRPIETQDPPLIKKREDPLIFGDGRSPLDEIDKD